MGSSFKVDEKDGLLVTFALGADVEEAGSLHKQGQPLAYGAVQVDYVDENDEATLS